VYCSLLHKKQILEEEMASTFGGEKSIDTNLCQWLVSFSLHSTFEGDISAKNTGFKSYHVHLPELVYIQSC